MSTRAGSIACGLLLALTACSRLPPSQAPAVRSADAAAASDAEPIVLAGAPTAVPETSPDPSKDVAAADADPSTQPPSSAPSDYSSAAPPQPPADPLEPVNRRLYAVDTVVGRAIKSRPRISSLSEPRSRGVVHAARNALENLDEPSSAANDLLQRKVASAGRTAVRFVINSTVGVAGLFDVAKRLGLERRRNNLDHTLAMYGAPAGPYLYLPVVGPATLRGALAMAAEGYFYPPRWLHLAAGIEPALRGAGYAKLAARAVRHADKTGSPGQEGDDGYRRMRSAYYASTSGPPRSAPRPPAPGGSRPSALASLATGD